MRLDARRPAGVPWSPVVADEAQHLKNGPRRRRGGLHRADGRRAGRSASAGSRLRSGKAAIRSSTAPSATRRCTCTGRVRPVQVGAGVGPRLDGRVPPAVVVHDVLRAGGIAPGAGPP
ncbi:hypothetical protein GCM10010259_62420 [Streptomyces daghestanicus]|uniref:Uncharacterized protein n=1 Tax=Streptomyces daghestanicus TaxID=66885 RepID=A0ABQ3PVK6_9ACTN|nr:hypothetical protein GCM10010259_62420 [Streptomyces daghestanicus]GHI29047.1 hypothetical protein Sdagh_07770 [Streptomyces daghestanicus]